MKKMESFGKTDIGLKRSNNEDVFYMDSERTFCLVADGMGGAAAGELASLIFADSVREIFEKSSGRSEADLTQLVKASFKTANKRILDHIRDNPNHNGMGCTAELLAYKNGVVVLGHIGDSRTYRFRRGHLKQLTRDHSLVQEQIDHGLISVHEARKHPLRNVISRAVGITGTFVPDLIPISLQDNDMFLICSDGLTDMIEDDQISEVLSSQASLERKIQELIDLAKTAGGYDNITVVLCHFK